MQNEKVKNDDELEFKPLSFFREFFLPEEKLADYYRKKREYEYTIKYKIPLIEGETVEELKLKLKEISGEWYNCQYNGKSIHIYTIQELFPDYNDPQAIIDIEKNKDRLRETLYNGDLVAIGTAGSISISLPVDIVP